MRRLLILVVVAACGGSGPAPQPPTALPAAPVARPIEAPLPPPPALPPIPDAPQPAPAALLVTATVGDPLGSLAAFASYVDAARPGLGAMLRPDALIGQASALVDLRGVDLSRPLRGYLLDPQAFPQPLVMVVAIADERALRAQAEAMAYAVIVHDGWAAVGSDDALRTVAAHALTTGLAPPRSPRPQVTVAMPAVMARYGASARAVMDAALASQPGTSPVMARAMVDLYLALFDQLSELSLELDADPQRATVTLAAVGKPDSKLAGFARRQQAASFALLERLGAAMVVGGARLDTAAIYEDLLRLSVPLMSESTGTGTASVAADLFRRWPALASGEAALQVALPPGGFAMSFLWDVNDGAAAQALWLDYLRTLRGSTGDLAYTVALDAARYRGVRFARATAAAVPGTRSAQQLAVLGGRFDFGVAVPGKVLAVTAGSDVLTSLRRLTDVALPRKRKPPVDAALAATLAVARARGDSALVAADLPALLATFAGRPPAAPAREWSALGLRADGDAVLITATLPATQLAPLLP